MVLNLKKNTPIILGRNLDIRRGHCNGTRYTIIDTTQRLIIVRRLEAISDDGIVTVPRIPILTKDNEFPFIMKGFQFPLRLAYGITFNRAQGQSLDCCGILLPRSVWTHGQLYVGLSRCGNKKILKCTLTNLNLWKWVFLQKIFIQEMSFTENYFNKKLPFIFYTKNVP